MRIPSRFALATGPFRRVPMPYANLASPNRERVGTGAPTAQKGLPQALEESPGVFEKQHPKWPRRAPACSPASRKSRDIC